MHYDFTLQRLFRLRRASSGFFAPAGIAQVFPNHSSPWILPCAQSTCTRRLEIPHFFAASSIEMYSIIHTPPKTKQAYCRVWPYFLLSQTERGLGIQVDPAERFSDVSNILSILYTTWRTITICRSMCEDMFSGEMLRPWDGKHF